MGSMVIIINYPILVIAMHGLPEYGYLHLVNTLMIKTFSINDKPGLFLFLLLSYFVGFIIQAISATCFGGINNCLKNDAKCDFFLKGDRVSRLLCEGMHGFLHNTKPYKWITIPCLWENCKYVGGNPIAGNQEYAQFQLFLEQNKSYASYVEWEKFLTTTYEYMLIVFVISAPGYLVYAGSSIYRFHHLFINFSLILLFSLIWVICFFLWNAYLVHRKARDIAGVETYRLFKEKRMALR
jgi:hypothetical protein